MKGIIVFVILKCGLLQAFTIMDQNRDGFIDKNDLRDTFAALGKYLRVFLSVFLLVLKH